MKIVRQVLTLIEQSEGLRLKAYKDVAGHWTIGIGHLLTEGEDGADITKEQAYELLQGDLEQAMKQVTDLVTVPINDNQFSALVSFTFNLGQGALKRSTLLRKLNEGDYEGAAQEFSRWTKAGPKGMKVDQKGLIKRRYAEEILFRTPVPIWQPSHEVWSGQAGDIEGFEFAAARPGTVMIMVAPIVEEFYGSGAEGDGTDGEGEG